MSRRDLFVTVEPDSPTVQCGVDLDRKSIVLNLTREEAVEFARMLTMAVEGDRTLTSRVEPVEPAPRWFVNVYALDRLYGGPEEGGWWFDCGEPVESVEVPDEQHALVVQGRMMREYPSTGARSSMSYGRSGNGVVDYAVWIEDHPAAHWPEHYPRYE